MYKTKNSAINYTVSLNFLLDKHIRTINMQTGKVNKPGRKQNWMG